MKKCKGCKKVLPLERFARNKNLKDGRENKCKDCRYKAKLKYECECEICGTKFMATKPTIKYCSQKCVGESRKKRVIGPCSNCGKKLEIPQYKIKQHKDFYCDLNCRGQHLSRTLKGENNPNYTQVDYKCDGCGKVFRIQPNRIRNQKYSFCTYECYKANIGKYFSGKNASNYNPNLSEWDRIVGRDYPEYKQWRMSVFERDNYTCQKCKDDTGGNLEAHHILNYMEHLDLRTTVSNGITLCKTCHKRFHDKYGYTKNNRKQLLNYLSNN